MRWVFPPQLRVQIQKLRAHVYTYCNKILQVKGGILSQCSGTSAHHLFPPQGPQTQRSDFAETHLSRYLWTTTAGGCFGHKEPFFNPTNVSWRVTSWSFRWHIEFRWREKYLGTSHVVHLRVLCTWLKQPYHINGFWNAKVSISAEILPFDCDSVCWDDSRISVFTKVPF